MLVFLYFKILVKWFKISLLVISFRLFNTYLPFNLYSTQNLFHDHEAAICAMVCLLQEGDSKLFDGTKHILISIPTTISTPDSSCGASRK